MAIKDGERRPGRRRCSSDVSSDDARGDLINQSVTSKGLLFLLMILNSGRSLILTLLSNMLVHF